MHVLWEPEYTQNAQPNGSERKSRFSLACHSYCARRRTSLPCNGGMNREPSKGKRRKIEATDGSPFLNRVAPARVADPKGACCPKNKHQCIRQIRDMGSLISSTEISVINRTQAKRCLGTSFCFFFLRPVLRRYFRSQSMCANIQDRVPTLVDYIGRY